MARTLYIKAGSEPCRRLRAKLEADGRPLRVVDLTANPEFVPELVKLTGGRRVLPVLVDGARISVAPEGGDDF